MLLNNRRQSYLLNARTTGRVVASIREDKIMKKAQQSERVSRFELSIEPQRVPTSKPQSNEAVAARARVVVITSA